MKQYLRGGSVENKSNAFSNLTSQQIVSDLIHKREIFN